MISKLRVLVDKFIKKFCLFQIVFKCKPKISNKEPFFTHHVN